MPFQIDDNQLERALAEVEAEIAPMLKNETQRLNKAVGDEESAPGEESPPPEEGSPPPSPEGSAGPPPGPEGSPPPGPEGSAPPPEDDGFPQDPAQLEQMVAQLPPEQQDALYLAAKKVIFSRGAGAGGPPPEASPAPGAGAPPPPAGPPAMKAEMKSSPGNGGKVLKNEGNDMKPDEVQKLLKSQEDAFNAKLEKLTETVAAGFSRIAGVPVRKSVQGVSQAVPMVKSEDAEKPEIKLSKAEIDERLRDVIRNGHKGNKLAKKDAAKIHRFYEQPAATRDVSAIAHLLQD